MRKPNSQIINHLDFDLTCDVIGDIEINEIEYAYFDNFSRSIERRLNSVNPFRSFRYLRRGKTPPTDVDRAKPGGQS